MKPTKLECKDCKEYKDCSIKDNSSEFCPIRIWMNIVNQLLGVR